MTVNVEQFRVGADPGAAEQAELARARAAEQAAATERQIATMVDRMAMAAGVSRGDVMLDRDTRRLSAVATVLPGLSYEGYRELEQRVAANTPGWTVHLRPPPQALPSIALGEDGPTEQGAAAEATVIWAATRIGLPVSLSGPDDQIEALATRLRSAGVQVDGMDAATGDTITVRWAQLPR